MIDNKKEVPGYRFRQYYIPARMMPGLIRYKTQGVRPGHFLSAVLENDLKGAMERVDDENALNMVAYAAYLYNEMPIGCHGSKEKVEAWIESHKKKEDGE